jgi:hypothetical protein
MRLWSLHPQYLDPAGLVAVWREGLLAGQTKGYKHHPQLAHLTNKVRARRPEWLANVPAPRSMKPHPLFRSVPGAVEHWERG